ncbi:type II toxin-antitoxin system VapC family toxin [bacterium]|nr:MAG: type II toxin-antitoxin system VapC family toxin [bacterium]
MIPFPAWKTFVKVSLLDTHVFLWFLSDDPKLSSEAKRSLEDSEHRLYLSAISAFEISIKHGLGKLPLKVPLEELLTRQLEMNRIELLPILPKHLVAYATLPFPANGHRDPFDRLLVAQAKSEEIALFTLDDALAEYGISPAWA